MSLKLKVEVEVAWSGLFPAFRFSDAALNPAWPDGVAMQSSSGLRLIVVARQFRMGLHKTGVETQTELVIAQEF